jgi:hypothetical protein
MLDGFDEPIYQLAALQEVMDEDTSEKVMV